MSEPSEGFNARIARLLATGLSDEQLRLIGEVTILWNSASTRFQQFVWLAANWSDKVGVLVTSDLNAASLVTLAKNMVSQEVKDDYVKDCATAAIDLFDEMRISRNRIVHGLPVLVPDAVTTSTLQHATARQGSGLKITTSNVTVDDLRSLVGNMSISSLAVEGGIFQFFILRMEREGHISKDDHLGNLERALLVPIEEVKSRTETLRRQRNNLPKSN